MPKQEKNESEIGHLESNKNLISDHAHLSYFIFQPRASKFNRQLVGFFFFI